MKHTIGTTRFESIATWNKHWGGTRQWRFGQLIKDMHMHVSLLTRLIIDHVQEELQKKKGTKLV
jgi:hypothetical protein